MSHKKRITIEVDPQIATVALGMTRLLLHVKCIEQENLPEEDRFFNRSQLNEVWEALSEIYNKCMDASGLREMMANDPEGMAEIERDIIESGMVEALKLA